ncbi:MAG: hypothetical protein IKJ32_02930 [Clostridia bacterium]|nr:hypothetical protein [Clostridia bacterium]
MERYEGLKRIKSDEEYEAAKKRLEEYLVQYKWIAETESPLDDIFDSLMECSKIRKIYENEEAKSEEDKEREIVDNQEEIDNEHRILSLKRQFDELKNGTYVANLRRNITALFITIGEYEARLEKAEKNVPDSDVVDGVEEKKKDYIIKWKGRRFRFFWANFTGLVPGELMNMDVEDRNEIPLFVKQKYGLISINEPVPAERQKQNMALVIAGQKTKFSMKWFSNPVNEFIASRGITQVNKLKKNEVEAPVAEENSTTSKGRRRKGGKNQKRTDRSEREDFGRDER